MKRLLTALILPALVLVAPPAAGATAPQMDIAIGDRAVVDRSGTATVPVTVTCSFDTSAEQTSGTLTVTLTQKSRSGDATATGTVPITCDGFTRVYTVTVTPTSTEGLRPGVLTAGAHGQATGYFSRQVCAVDPYDNVSCGTHSWTEEMSAFDGPQEVRAVGSR